MGDIFLNIYVVQRQFMIKRAFQEDLTVTRLAETLQPELRYLINPRFFVVGKNTIPLPEGSKDVDAWRSLWCTSPDDHAEAKRNETLREMFPYHVEDELHIVVRSFLIPRIQIYRMDDKTEYTIEHAEPLDDLEKLLVGKFSKKEMAVMRLIKPAHPILYDKTDLAAVEAAEAAIASALSESEDDGGSSMSRRFQCGDAVEDAFPWGGFRRHISLIIYIPDLDTVSDLPALQRQLYFQSYPHKAPSSEGMPDKFHAAQKDPDRVVYCGRDTESAVPASLLDESLCKFQHNLKTCTATPDDIRLFRELRGKLTAIYDSESERRDALMALLRRLIPDGSVLHCAGIGSFTTDGDIRATHKGVEYMLYVEEVKNEVAGTQSEPYFQAIHYWLAFIHSCLLQLTDAQKQHINFPTLILSHFGPFISIAAAAFGGSPNVETLVTLSLHVHSTNTEALAEGERMVCALRTCLYDLFDFYRARISSDSCQSGFPFRNYYLSGADCNYFVYDRYLAEKRVFFAHSKEDPSQLLCVKFSRRYSEKAHRAAFELNIAPHLYAVDTFYGWCMIVMADLSGNYVTLDKQPGHDTTGFRDSLIKLHEAGFVHGDVRDLNVLVRKASAPTTLPEFQLVDFDWAGVANEAKYPNDMNPQVQRAEDALVGGRIRPEHDMYMCSRL